MLFLSHFPIEFFQGDSEDEESPNESRQKEDKDSVFARLEESRKMLEDELGFSRFMKVYKYIQVRQVCQYCALYGQYSLTFGQAAVMTS